MLLEHAILSHHGELEWGSPKRPSTIEALLLHHADNLDAKAAGIRARLLGSRHAWMRRGRTPATCSGVHCGLRELPRTTDPRRPSRTCVCRAVGVCACMPSGRGDTRVSTRIGGAIG